MIEKDENKQNSSWISCLAAKEEINEVTASFE